MTHNVGFGSVEKIYRIVSPETYKKTHKVRPGNDLDLMISWTSEGNSFIIRSQEIYLLLFTKVASIVDIIGINEYPGSDNILHVGHHISIFSF